MSRLRSLGLVLLAGTMSCTEGTTGPFLRLPVILERSTVTESGDSVPTISTAADTVIALLAVDACQEYTADAAVLERRIEITVSEILPPRFCTDQLRAAALLTAKVTGIPSGDYVAELHARLTSSQGNLVLRTLTSTSVVVP